MINLKIQRENMVESQIRTNDVTDGRIIAAMMELERENFVPASSRTLAYMEGEITVKTDEATGRQRTLLAPMVLAKLIQLAKIESTDLVLDIGCTTGYSTALLARLADAVVGLESDKDLVEKATANLTKAEIDNAAIIEGPLGEGYAAEGPYDVIFINGRVPEPPQALLKQLKPGGRAVGVMGRGAESKAMIWLSNGDTCSGREAFDAAAPELPGFETVSEFTF